MPEISRFSGIIVSMYYNDHPPPHFHVRYGNQKALVDIDGLTILEGSLAPRLYGLVMDWAARHQIELRQNWDRARHNQPLEAIQALE